MTFYSVGLLIRLKATIFTRPYPRSEGDTVFSGVRLCVCFDGC